MNLLLNASPPNPFDVVTSNSVCYLGHMKERALGNISCDLDTKVNFLVNASSL